ncbi:MAG: hypothetical protein M9962_08170 [Oligoflexia bacterium]|nr:hypothetical protein [Oligoflexia bacterium]
MRHIKLLFSVLFIALFTLTACGPKETDTTTAKELEDREELRRTYAALVGLYRGKVIPDTNPQKTIPVEIRINIVEVADGVNENQEIRFRPELRGYFLRLDMDPGVVPIVQRPLSMRYYKETKELIMKNSDTVISPTPRQGETSVRAFVAGDELQGSISFVMGKQTDGRLEVKRVQF